MHTTLGQNFYTKFVSSITRRRKQVRRSYWCESSRILISRRFAPVAPLDLLSASSYRRNKFRIEFLSQGRMHFFIAPPQLPNLIPKHNFYLNFITTLYNFIYFIYFYKIIYFYKFIYFYTFVFSYFLYFKVGGQGGAL